MDQLQEIDESALKTALEGPVLVDCLGKALEEYLSNAQGELGARVSAALIQEGREEARANPRGRRKKGDPEPRPWEGLFDERLEMERAAAMQAARDRFNSIVQEQLGEHPRVIGIHQIGAQATEVFFGRERPDTCCPTVIGASCGECPKKPQKILEDFGVDSQRLEELLGRGGLGPEAILAVRARLEIAFEEQRRQKEVPLNAHTLRKEWTQVAAVIGVSPGRMPRGQEVRFFRAVEQRLTDLMKREGLIKLDGDGADQVTDFHAAVNTFLYDSEPTSLTQSS